MKKVIAPYTYACHFAFERVGKLNPFLMTTSIGAFKIASGQASHMAAIKLLERANDNKDVGAYDNACLDWNCTACRTYWKPFWELAEMLSTAPFGLCLHCYKDEKKAGAFCERLPCPDHA